MACHNVKITTFNILSKITRQAKNQENVTHNQKKKKRLIAIDLEMTELADEKF